MLRAGRFHGLRQHASARNGESAVKQAAHTTGRLKRTAGYTHRTYELRTSTGRKRRVLVAIPTGVPRNKPLPVVLAFHAHNQYAENFATNAGLEGVAARAKAIVVYPQGVDRSWEGPTYARTHRGEDVRFARQAYAVCPRSMRWIGSESTPLGSPMVVEWR